MPSRALLVRRFRIDGNVLLSESANSGVVLGLNGVGGPRRLARALLADPLTSEQQWEKQLTADDNDERAILLRQDSGLLIEMMTFIMLTVGIGTGSGPTWTTDIRS